MSRIKPSTVLLLLLFIVFLLSCAAATLAQQCPTTPESQQTRTSVKHHKPPAGIHVTSIELTEMFDWALPANISDKAVRKSDEPIDEREGQAFEFTGDLWRVKFEMNDCDLHLELSAPDAGKNARRVIVEIPARAWANTARSHALQILSDQQAAHKATANGNFKTPVRVRVTGLAFFDATHWSKKNPQVGHGHGTAAVKTLWELHPVWKLVVVTQ